MVVIIDVDGIDYDNHILLLSLRTITQTFQQLPK